MTNKIAPVTEFSWLRMVGYTALTCLIWLALRLLIPAIAHGAGTGPVSGGAEVGVARPAARLG